jgi:hypothetical protein
MSLMLMTDHLGIAGTGWIWVSLRAICHICNHRLRSPSLGRCFVWEVLCKSNAVVSMLLHGSGLS